MMIRSTLLLILFGTIFPGAQNLGAQNSQTYYNNYPPQLIQPYLGSTLDNGCTQGGEALSWFFQWSAVYGAQGYQLMVMPPNSDQPFENVYVVQNSYQLHLPNFYIYDNNLYGWTWYVRANVNGMYGAWSQVGAFQVEPSNTDCPAVTQQYLPTVAKPLSSPILRSPIDYNRVVNHAGGSPGKYHWFFEWDAVEGADLYQLELIGPKGTTVQIFETPISKYRYELEFPSNQYEENWQWRVRANGQGQWSPWSPKATFVLERLGPVICD